MQGLGLLLLTAAALKGHELLTVPVADKGFWSWRPFLIFQVEFELVLAIWLLSGVFKPLAWLAGLLCFGLFCCITLYTALTGAASCGCFGAVDVNPWITLLAIDLPAVVALAVVRPPSALAAVLSCLRALPAAAIGEWDAIGRAAARIAPPVPCMRRFVVAVALTLAALGITTPILAVYEPAKVAAAYEVLEPETWTGRRLPILEHIDIAETLEKGHWLVLLYHRDCPDCTVAILEYEQMARDLAGDGGFMQIALIAVPPYGRGAAGQNSSCTIGRLAEAKEWFVATPAVVLLSNGQVMSAWEEKTPGLETILRQMGKRPNGIGDSSFPPTNSSTHVPRREVSTVIELWDDW
jgi:hypothetical protein